ncbi:hypothetical protein [Nocardiopsis sp. FIRDI 009]|uniref:hypothetical protein n=1 Tax=Nocardiopsis sp. FIRDI 009 TaxID=714197 RepID=UPI000E2406C0|nr:hypothetical protein [Nocardiopsis sp. FIRDI 009]
MRYLRNLILRLWPPPCGRHARSNLRPAAHDDSHPIPRPRPPVLQEESIVPPPVRAPRSAAPAPVDDPPLARPYLLAVERHHAEQPARGRDLLAPDADARPEPPVDLEDLAIAVRSWRELAGVGA